jgi:DNA-binding XRE family transcriptional regulator
VSTLECRSRPFAAIGSFSTVCNIVMMPRRSEYQPCHSPNREADTILMPQEDFAEEVNVHRTYIDSIELSKLSVGIDVANESAIALRMDLTDLVRQAE